MTRPIAEKLVSEPFLKSGFSDIFVGINMGNNIWEYLGPRRSPEVPKTGPFEVKYKGRRTRNTQVCRHKITAYVYLSYMSSCARPISEKLVFEPFLKSWFSENKHALRVAAAFGEKSC